MSMKDTEPSSGPAGRPGAVPSPPQGQRAWLRAGRTNPWLVFLLPFLVYMIVGCLEPGPPTDGVKTASWLDLGIEYRHYPLIYSLKILLTIAAMAYVSPGYRHIPCRTNIDVPHQSDSQATNVSLAPPLARRTSGGNPFLLAIIVGVAGAAAWIGLAVGQRYAQEQLGWTLGLDARSAFNPLDEKLIPSQAWAYCFLAIRFLGLALIVPVIEEFFLRGFVMRFVMSADWWNVPIATVNRLALIAGTVVPLLTHPICEALAVAVWFSAITWLFLRTRNLWSCVAAHATTNLLLGIYVVASGNWWLM
jgi:uncharacterized protein